MVNIFKAFVFVFVASPIGMVLVFVAYHDRLYKNNISRQDDGVINNIASVTATISRNLTRALQTRNSGRDALSFPPPVYYNSTSHPNVLSSFNDKPKYSGVRRDSCTDCFRHDFDYILQNTDICHDSKGQIDLLMLIFTSHVNRRNRDVVRSTWASISRNNTGRVRYVFLLGKVEDYFLMKSVEEESLQNEDLLMEDFFDSYANLTYKTIMGYKWASIHCPQARFVLKTDDDMWINVPNLISVVNYNATMLQDAVIGACIFNVPVIRISNSKWYASFKSYPHARYRGFCSGTGYVTSMAVVRQVYHESKNVPFFHLEDVYIAFCVFKLGLNLQFVPGFIADRKETDNPCLFKSTETITTHSLQLQYINQIWKTKCPSTT